MALQNLNEADLSLIRLAKAGVETERGTETLEGYRRLAAMGYVEEYELKVNSVAWRLTRQGLNLIHASDE